MGSIFPSRSARTFLTDESVPRRIAEMSGAAECGNAVEVGPGMGCLSAELCRRADKVVAVELDRALMPVLGETLAEFDDFEVVQGDVLSKPTLRRSARRNSVTERRSRAPTCRIISPHRPSRRCSRAARSSR